jgi:hypothetical protein
MYYPVPFVPPKFYVKVYAVAEIIKTLKKASVISPKKVENSIGF